VRGRIARLLAAPEDQKPAGNPVNRIPPGPPAHPFRAVPSGDTFVLRFEARVSAREPATEPRDAGDIQGIGEASGDLDRACAPGFAARDPSAATAHSSAPRRNSSRRVPHGPWQPRCSSAPPV